MGTSGKVYSMVPPPGFVQVDALDEGSQERFTLEHGARIQNAVEVFNVGFDLRLAHLDRLGSPLQFKIDSGAL